MGNPESERKAEFYQQPWCHEAVPRYFYSKVCKAVLYTHTCKRSVILHDYVYIYICSYIYTSFIFCFWQVAQRKTELEQAMGIKHP